MNQSTNQPFNPLINQYHLFGSKETLGPHVNILVDSNMFGFFSKPQELFDEGWDGNLGLKNSG